ncbi:hypothetical protein Pst134EB_026565 [Puccinia striiformis f. sp. tritici]|nr:hypothetical protein Pst134EB_026565 [Puccinia striiformis f. sp. tritici]
MDIPLGAVSVSHTPPQSIRPALSRQPPSRRISVVIHPLFVCRGPIDPVSSVASFSDILRSCPLSCRHAGLLRRTKSTRPRNFFQFLRIGFSTNAESFVVMRGSGLPPASAGTRDRIV